MVSAQIFYAGLNSLEENKLKEEIL